MLGSDGAILTRGPGKIFLNVSENKSSNRNLILYIFGIHGNAFDITQNALIPQLLGDFASRLSAGTLSPASAAPARPSGSATVPDHSVPNGRKSRLRRHPPWCRIRIVLLVIKGGRWNVSGTLLSVKCSRVVRSRCVCLYCHAVAWILVMEISIRIAQWK